MLFVPSAEMKRKLNQGEVIGGVNVLFLTKEDDRLIDAILIFLQILRENGMCLCTKLFS